MKDEFLQTISLVQSKRNISELPEIYKYVESLSEFDYHVMMRFIESKFRYRLGGEAIIVNSTLRFLKEELKKTKRRVCDKT